MTARGAKARAEITVERLAEAYPDVQCALIHDSPFQLLVATILSAQCTDERVNMVTLAVFARFPNPVDLARANPEELETLIHSTGFFRAKAKNLIGMAQTLADEFHSEVPREIEQLTRLPGVGRKTANVIRSVAFGLPGLPVDTHVTRISRLLKLTSETDADKIEAGLNKLIPERERGNFSLRLIEHGRQVCIARRPRCGECVLSDVCPSAHV